MSDLIPVFNATFGDSPVNAVDARALYDFLEVKSEFRNWIKNRIDGYGFVQGIDFIAGNFLPGSDRIDYHCSIDMAKELAMVERNAKGKQARQYFIECEKRLLGKTEAVPQLSPIEHGMRIMAQAKAFAIDVIGLVGNQALLSANQATNKAIGINVLEHFGQTHLKADSRGLTYTPTQLGAEFFKPALAPQVVNLLLRDAHFQKKVDRRWEPTDAAAGLYEWLDTSKRQQSGVPVKQLKWFPDVLRHPDMEPMIKELELTRA
jgi:phage anti-repressor protein